VEKWRFHCDWVDGGPVIAKDGTIYFGEKGYPDFLYALFPNGTLKWKYMLGDWIWSTPALSDDGTIYVGTMGTGFYALNPDGSLKWHYIIASSAIASSPAIASDGTIYFGTLTGSYDGYLYALNSNGTLRWRYPTGNFITSDPAIGPDGTIYIGSFDTYLYAMNPNGTLKWRFKTGDIIKGQASIAADGTVYISSFDQHLYALYPNNGTLKWQMYLWGTESTPAIAADGTIYVGSDKLYAVNPNGTLRWGFYLGSKAFIAQSAPAVSADGTIYVGTNIGEVQGGDIIAVNPNGTERWRKRIANDWVDSSPAIGSDGTVYIGSASDNATDSYGYLHAFGRGPVKVDTEGPYIGMPGVPLQFHCTVLGGIPPYTYLWSFGDGDTSSLQNPTHIYTQSRVYNVTLQATDSEGNSSSDSTTALISAPPVPTITGPLQGKIKHAYDYTFVAIDPEGDDVYYYILWGDGDGISWIGPYRSGEAIVKSHHWNTRATYAIQCKAKDVHGCESNWTTLLVTMPLSFDLPHFRFFEWLFERFPHAFPILRHLLGQ
jgi:outer membrane protein assembly factor BamB